MYVGGSICHLLDIRGVFVPDFHEPLSASGSRLSRQLELNLTEKALRALDVVRVNEFTDYEPKQNYHVCSRFHHEFNMAFFDYDKENKYFSLFMTIDLIVWYHIDQQSSSPLVFDLINSCPLYTLNPK